MACKGCSGVSICDAAIDCLGFENNIGQGCTGLTDGFSRVQITATGEIEICRNIGGVCTCATLSSIADILVDNGDGTFTHTSTAGVAVTIDICANLVHCTVEQLGNVTAGAIAGQILVSDGTDWNPQNFANDTFVFNGTDTITHTSTAGVVTAVNICTQVLPNCTVEQLGNVTAGAIVGQVLVSDGTDWNPTTLGVDTLVDNLNGTFTHTSNNGTIVTLDVCAMLLAGLCDDILVDNLNGTFTHTSMQGVITTIDICASLALANCFLQTNSFNIMSTVTLPAVIPAAPVGVYTAVEPPVLTVLTNPATTTMQCTVTMTGVELNATNTGGAANDRLNFRFEMTFDGGATWLALSGWDLNHQFDAPGTPGDFFESNTQSGTFSNVVIPPGGTQTVGVRRLYNSTTGFTGQVFTGTSGLSTSCNASP
jgi:hypothetical protein